MVGYLYHELSVNSDVEAWFDETQRISNTTSSTCAMSWRAGWPVLFPRFVKPIATFGRNVLYQVRHNRLFRLVHHHADALWDKSSDQPPAGENGLKGRNPRSSRNLGSS